MIDRSGDAAVFSRMGPLQRKKPVGINCFLATHLNELRSLSASYRGGQQRS
jgi:hypothetical protein